MDKIINSCPFCGSKKVILDNYRDIENKKRFFVSCLSCNATTGFYSNGDSAIKFWNQAVKNKIITNWIHSIIFRIRIILKRWLEIKDGE